MDRTSACFCGHGERLEGDFPEPLSVMLSVSMATNVSPLMAGLDDDVRAEPRSVRARRSRPTAEC